MSASKFFIVLLFICAIIANACSQESQSLTGIFVGSTPCNAYIRSSLGISVKTNCEFIKWETSLQNPKENKGAFLLVLNYGESQPNTTGFKDGGEKITVTGEYIINNNNPGLPFYRLRSLKLPSSLYLIKMDNNIFHFSDSNKKLLVGNAGWGYVLNRLKL